VYVIGGLYGNKLALDEISIIAAREKVKPRLVFNGDFNFFNSSSAKVFDTVNEMIQGSGALATLGNVERSLIDASSSMPRRNVDGSGIYVNCGCSYPDYVSPSYVDRSNQIVGKLVETSMQSNGEAVKWLATLPNFLNLQLNGKNISVLHGDCFSLSGWRFAAESIDPADEKLRRSVVANGGVITTTTLAELATWMREMNTDIVACTHTCLPIATVVPGAGKDGKSDGILINNGSAGMPNFTDPKARQCGVITRIGSESHGPPPVGTSLYHSTAVGNIRVDALAVSYGVEWKHAFERDWREGTAAHSNYSSRIAHGPSDYYMAQAIRQGFHRSHERY
jgi:hypothetical protein